MKKFLSILMVMLLALSVLTACGGNNDSADVDTTEPGEEQNIDVDLDSLKTLGDIFDAKGDNALSSYAQYGKVFAVSFLYNDETYRADADLPDDVEKKLEDIDILEDGYQEEMKKLLSPIEIKSVVNLNEAMPSQEEADKLVGKTGKELLDDGFDFTYADYDSMQFNFNKGPYEYAVIFEGKIENGEDFDADKDIDPLVVKSASVVGIGDPVYIEDPQE